MRVQLARPVDAPAVLAMLDAGSDIEARIHRVQVFGFPCWGFVRASDRLTLAAGGLVPRPCAEGRLLEAWFCSRPEAAADMLGVLRLARLTILKHCEDAPATVQAYVREGWRPGARIAAALGFGFDRTGSVPDIGAAERWIMRV